MSLEQKYKIVAIVVLLLAAISGMLIHRSANFAKNHFDLIANDAVPSLIVLGKLDVAASKVVGSAFSCAAIQCEQDDLSPFGVAFAQEERGELYAAINELEQAIAGLRARQTDDRQHDAADIQLAAQIEDSSAALLMSARRLVEASGEEDWNLLPVQQLDDAHHRFSAFVATAIASEEAKFERIREAGTSSASQPIVTMWLAMLGMALVFLAFSVLLHRLVLHPLTKLRQATEAVGQGDLNTRVGSTGFGEVGNLAIAFDQMAAAIQNHAEQRQRVEQALRVNEASFRLLAENAQDLVSRFNVLPENHFAYMSPSVTKILGYTPEDHYADPNFTLKIMHPADIPLFLEIIQSVDKFTTPFEIRLFHKDGALVWLEMRNVPVYDESGQLISFTGIARDITERKRAEAMLREQKEAAEAAARSKAEFLANMSHEIRTPLNAVIGMTSLLLDTPLVGEQRDFLETIRTSGDSLLTVINDILDFSKIEAGKLELEKQPFDVHQCVEDVLDLMARTAAEKGLELLCEFRPDVPRTVIGDVSRVRQILVNLVGNAIKFTETGEVVVTVTGRQVQERDVSSVPAEAARHGYELCFTVRDTGIGLSATQMPRLFASFSQVDSSTTRKYGGTGLGLAISKQLCEIMGGQIWVESEGLAGRGSSFHFTILVQEDGVQRAQPANRDRNLPNEDNLHSTHLQGKRVLLVDDNATNRLILMRYAEAWGMEPYAAASGAEALAYVQRGKSFDAAILDMCMPEMDGVELARRLQSHTRLAHMPIIMLSSLECRAVEAKTEHMELAAIVTKPMKQERLHRILLEALAQEEQPWPDKPPLSKPPAPKPDIHLAQRLPLRLLLVEDNLVNQKVARHMLTSRGYRADIAANGIEALIALERQPYDVILMDVQMPEMDGLEATRQIRARWADGERPYIIAMTAHALTGDAERCLAAGMDDYLAKPIQRDLLMAALERSCEQTALQPAL